MTFLQKLPPNYSLITLAVVMVLYSLVMDTLFVPAGETLFVPSFFLEFTCVFLVSFTILVLFFRKNKSREELISRIVHAVIAFGLMYVVLCLFSALKSILHIVQPYNLDVEFIAIEKFVHFGFLPIQLIPIFTENSFILKFLDTIYFFWFFFIYAYFCFVLFKNPYSQMRERYVFCFAAVWFFVGSIAATLLASVGPIFLDDFFLQDTYSTDLEHVRKIMNVFEVYATEHDLLVMKFKNLLVDMLHDEKAVNFNAASAMPSVHVAMVSLMTFHSFHVNRSLFISMVLYLLLTMAGSVLLCWHYAIDGYVAIILTYGLWKLSALLPVPSRSPLLRFV